MIKFDENYKLLEEMYSDGYFPDFLVDKVRAQITKVIELLEKGESNSKKIQKAFDKMTVAINKLEGEFEENDSEIETVARDSIGKTVEYILKWFELDIDVEDAIRKRDW